MRAAEGSTCLGLGELLRAIGWRSENAWRRASCTVPRLQAHPLVAINEDLNSLNSLRVYFTEHLKGTPHLHCLYSEARHLRIGMERADDTYDAVGFIFWRFAGATLLLMVATLGLGA